MPRKKRSSGRKKAPAAAAREPEPVQEETETVPETEENQKESTEPQVEESATAVEEPVVEECQPEEVEEGAAAAAPDAEPSDKPEEGPGPSPRPSVSTPLEADAEEERGGFLNSLLTDQSYLLDVSVGFGPEENLKQPLQGFTADDEVQLFPVIESMSAKLFNIVQKMIACHKKDVESAMKARKGVLKFPYPKVKAYLCQLNLMETPEQDKGSQSKRAPHPFLLTEDEHMFSEEKFKMLRAVLDAGWKREVVMRSPGSTGRKTGDVYYYNPEGVKFRSSKQVAQHLSEIPDTPFTIENFSFAKVRISTNPDQEIVRKAYDGKSPPRSVPKPSTSKAKPPQPVKAESSKAIAPRPSTSKDSEPPEQRSPSDEPAKGVSSRRSIQPPKRYSGDAVLLLNKRKVQDEKHRNSNSNKGLMQMGMLPPKYPKGMEDTSSNLSEGMDYDLGQEETNSVAIKEIAEDSLFQISALRQSGGIDVDSMHRYVASQKQLSQKGMEGEIEQQRPLQAGPKRGEGSVICSIRCPGMDGIVPNLQCTRCLCLFHAECLGLPPNLLFNKYICTNCTEQGASSTTAAVPGTAFPPKNMILKKPGEVRRQPPGLAPIPHSGMRRSAIHRDVTVTLAGKEFSPGRIPPGRLPAPGASRGMVRGRGGMVSHVRHSASAAQVHPGQRVITHPDGSHVTMVSANPHLVKRGRGRPPSVPPSRQLPHISKNVSIQSLPRIHGAPPVPNLQPMGVPKAIPGKIQLPVMSGKPRPGVPTVPNLMKSSAFRLTVPPPSLSGRTFKKPIPPSHPPNLRLSSGQMIPRGAQPIMFDPSRPHTVKRYPQSICTIAGKKYVVLPKRNRQNTEYLTSVVTSPPVGNGTVSRRSNYAAVVDGTPNNSDAGMKRIETSMEEQETNCSEDVGSQNSAVQEEADGQIMDESMEEVSTDAGVEEATSMDGIEDGIEVNSSSEALAANQME